MSPVATSPIAVDARSLAERLDVSERTVRRLDAAGKLPRPVRIGGSVRWRLAEIEAWLAAGCPGRDTWDTSKTLNPGEAA